jgi:hypothetical protein
MITIIFGDQACGKTRNAEKLRAAFGCRTIVDDWRVGMPLPHNALALTNDYAVLNHENYAGKVVQFADAMKRTK